MSYFFQAYARRLQTHPISVNLSTSLVLMTVGDIMAQKIEKYQMEQNVFANDGRDSEQEDKMRNAPLAKRISLRRYRTKISEQHEHYENSRISKTDGNSCEEQIIFDHVGKENSKNLQSTIKLEAQDLAEKIQKLLQNEVNDIDWVRSGSMGVWATCFLTPGFMWLFKTFDKYLPHKTPFSIACRLVGAFLWSIPNNTAFFAYGTCVHHTIEWWDETQLIKTKMAEGLHENEDMTLPDFRFEDMISNIYKKLDAEIVTTIKNSARLWIPVNFVNFTVIPAYLRQVTMSGVSLVWNCYISLVQHRDIVTLEESDSAKENSSLGKTENIALVTND